MVTHRMSSDIFASIVEFGKAGKKKGGKKRGGKRKVSRIRIGLNLLLHLPYLSFTEKVNLLANIIFFFLALFSA